MYRSIIENAEERMAKTQSVLVSEYGALRAGRANPKVLDRLVVDYYGTPTPIKQLGNISVPEPRVLLISLWDVKALPLVEKEILKSDIGINPSNDGKNIRLVFPELNEERRKDLAKQVKKLAEDAKVAVRAIRRDANEQVKKLKKDSVLSEDDQKKAEDLLQKKTDGAVKDIDKLAADKEKEILSL